MHKIKSIELSNEIKRGRNQNFLFGLEWWVAIALTVILIGFHVVRSQYAGGLWRDEISTVSIAEEPSVALMYHSLIHESFPALTAFLLHFWRWTGAAAGTDHGLRMFGMLVGLALIGTLWRNAWRLGKVPPLFSLTYLALWPVVIVYGDSIRAYGLGMLLGMLNFRLMWEFVRLPTPRLKPFLLLTASSILSVQCLYQNSFLLLAFCVSGGLVSLINRRWQTIGSIVATGAIAALSLVPYVPILAEVRPVRDLLVPPPGTDLHIIDRLTTVLSNANSQISTLWAVVAIAVLLRLLYVLIVGFYSSRIKVGDVQRPGQLIINQRDLALYTLTAWGVGLLALYISLHVIGVELYAWHLTPAFSLTAVCFDATRALSGAPAGGPAELRQPALIRAQGRGSIVSLFTLASTGYLIFIMLWPAWLAVQIRQTNIDEVVSIVESQEASGDVILAIPYYIGSSFRRYYHGHNAVITLPLQGDIKFQDFVGLRAIMNTPQPIKPALDRLGSALRQKQRVWVVTCAPFSLPSNVVLELPLPPLPGTGWYFAPYARSWEDQGGYFLKSHATRIISSAVPHEQDVSRKEDIRQLIVASGWAGHLGEK